MRAPFRQRPRGERERELLRWVHRKRSGQQGHEPLGIFLQVRRQRGIEALRYLPLYACSHVRKVVLDDVDVVNDCRMVFVKDIADLHCRQICHSIYEREREPPGANFERIIWGALAAK